MFKELKNNEKELLQNIEYIINDYIIPNRHKGEYIRKVFDDFYKELKYNQELFMRYKRALEGLTVGGSEYYNNPERCAEDIRHRLDRQHEIIKRLVKEKNELRNEFKE